MNVKLCLCIIPNKLRVYDSHLFTHKSNGIVDTAINDLCTSPYGDA